MPTKRKRAGESPPDNKEKTDQDSSSTRRATRQTPVYPPAIPGTPKAKATAPAPVATPVPLPVLPGQAPASKGDPVAAVAAAAAAAAAAKRGRGRAKSSDGAGKSVPTTILPQGATVPGSLGSNPPNMNGTLGKENVRPADSVLSEMAYTTTQSPLPPQYSRLPVGAAGPNVAAVPSPRTDKPPPPVVTPVPPPKPPTIPIAEKPPLSADRNIDKVVLGKLCFRTWYPSYYGKEVLGDVSGNSRATGSKEGSVLDASKAPSKKDKDGSTILERLYVCPSCFKYAKEIVAWWGHVSACDKKGIIPGRKVYSHPRGRRKVLIAQDGTKGPGPKKRRGEGGVKYTEQVVQDEGEWSIWEVDGEVDGLFCQNLSLFAKLFLDNKSVFFDVTGFNYFLLVYTPPAKPEDEEPPVPQVTGFFSKEKMSWDNNNLACILVFPPWQRKGLGALLMGASYEISRREGILGGPEKPISDLGKKGYKRFWTGEIARWLLTLDANSVPTANGEIIVDVDDVSQGTWITPEDCLGVLRDMGIIEPAGMGPGKPPKPEPEEGEDGAEEVTEEAETSNEAAASEDKKSSKSKSASNKKKSVTATPSPAPAPPPMKMVPRVRVDKEAIYRYVTQHRIGLDKSCDPDGFVEGYAFKEDTDSVMDSQQGE